MLTKTFELTTVITCKAYCSHALIIGCFYSMQNIGAVARSTKGYQHITLFTEAANKSGVDKIKTMIVGNCGEVGAVYMQSLCREASTARQRRLAQAGAERSRETGSPRAAAP